MKHITTRFFESYKPAINGVLFLLVLSLVGAIVIYVREGVVKDGDLSDSSSVAYNSPSLVPVYIDEATQLKESTYDNNGEVLGLLSDFCGSSSPIENVPAVDVSGGLFPACIMSATVSTDMTPATLPALSESTSYPVTKNSIVRIVKITWPKVALTPRSQGAANESYPIEKKVVGNTTSLYTKAANPEVYTLSYESIMNPYSKDADEYQIDAASPETPFKIDAQVTAQTDSEEIGVIAQSNDLERSPDYENKMGEAYASMFLPPTGLVSEGSADVPYCGSSLPAMSVVNLENETHTAYLNKISGATQVLDKVKSIGGWIDCQFGAGSDCEETFITGLLIGSATGNTTKGGLENNSAGAMSVLYGSIIPPVGDNADEYKDGSASGKYALTGEYYITPCQISIDGDIKPINCYHFKNTATGQYALQESSINPSMIKGEDPTFPTQEEYYTALGEAYKREASSGCAN